jgi:hypothetical protein
LVDWAALFEREAWERVSRVEAENTVALVSTHEDVEVLVRKIAFLEDELAEARRAREVAEDKSCGLSDKAAYAEQQWEVSEKGCQLHFEELTLLQTRGSKLCLAIVNPPWVRNHLSDGMWIMALHHTEMARELVALRVALSSTVELVLGRSLEETFQVEVVHELVAEFWKLEERCSRLEWPGARIYDLVLGPPPSQV